MTAAYLSAGVSVIGIDTDSNRVRQIETGDVDLPEIERQEVAMAVVDGRLRINPPSAREVDGFLVCVPPGNGEHRRTLNGALDYVQDNLCCGHVVILVSTLFPGTTRYWANELQHGTGLVAGQDFFIAHSPERVNIGDKRFRVSNTPRLIGGYSPHCARVAMLLLSPICDQLVPVSSPEVAEFAKLLENTYRLVNVVLTNEIADVVRRCKVNPYEVVAAAATKPFGFEPFWPSVGAGGHCIPIVPKYLVEFAKQHGADIPLVDKALAANDARPRRIAEEIASTCIGKILIVGVAYKADVRDARRSMAFQVVEELRSLGVVADFYDPNIAEVNGVTGVAIDVLPDMSYNVAIILVKHSCLPWKNVGRIAHQIIDLCGATFTGLERN